MQKESANLNMKQIFKRYWKEVQGRNITLPSGVLIACVISASMSLVIGNNIALSITTKPEVNCYAPIPGSESYASYVVPILQNSIICLLFPFTGWLADTMIGRQRSITLSNWLCWIGVLFQLISLCIQYTTCGLPVNIAKYGISLLALIIIMFGSASLLSNIPAYGLEQLTEKSNAAVRAYIHWFTWGLFVGFGISYVQFVNSVIYRPKLVLITTLGTFIVDSLVLCLHACFHYQFEQTSVLKKNPYKMVYQVLKYAWKHKSPENRSALTYWENKIPNRIDLGKRKYGGPFAEGDVEDVKTFWKISGILLCMFGFFIPYYPGFLGAFQYINPFRGATTSLDGFGSFVLWYISQESILVVIPVMELILFPLFPKLEYFFLHSLRGIIVCYCSLLIALIAMIIITTVGYYLTPNYIPCLVTSITNHVQLTYLFFIIPLFFAGITSGPRFIFAFEFILSQSPSNMTGMLVGAYWLIQAFYINIGSWLQLPFSLLALDGPGKLPCTFWILLIHILICSFGMGVFVIAVKKYQGRQRGENYNYHSVIEATYDRALRNSDKNMEQELSSPYDFYIVDDIDYKNH